MQRGGFLAPARDNARPLCRHCPYWASRRRILKCHGNSGVAKIWPFDPSPMGVSGKLQLVVGALIFVGNPFPFPVIGGQHVLAADALLLCTVAWISLWTGACSRCVKFPVSPEPRAGSEPMGRKWHPAGLGPGSEPELEVTWRDKAQAATGSGGRT